MTSFLQGVAPTRYKTSKQLISTDTHTGKGRYKFTYSVELLPICRGDALWLPASTAATVGQVPRFMLCNKAPAGEIWRDIGRYREPAAGAPLIQPSP